MAPSPQIDESYVVYVQDAECRVQTSSSDHHHYQCASTEPPFPSQILLPSNKMLVPFLDFLSNLSQPPKLRVQSIIEIIPNHLRQSNIGWQ